MVQTKIIQVYPSILGNNDRTTFSERVYDALEPVLKDDKDGMTLLSTVKANNIALLDALSNVNRASPFTPRLKDIVSERTDVLSYMYKHIRIQKFNILDIKAMKAARMLEFALQQPKKKYRMSTHAGGGRAAKAIIKECSKKKNKEWLKHLGLDVYVAKLVELQSFFSETYTTKVSTEHKKKERNITKASNALFDSLELIFVHIYTQAVLRQGVYTKAINTINEIIEDIVTPARSRKTRASNKSEEEIGESTNNGTDQEQAA